MYALRDNLNNIVGHSPVPQKPNDSKIDETSAEWRAYKIKSVARDKVKEIEDGLKSDLSKTFVVDTLTPPMNTYQWGVDAMKYWQGYTADKEFFDHGLTANEFTVFYTDDDTEVPLTFAEARLVYDGAKFVEIVGYRKAKRKLAEIREHAANLDSVSLEGVTW